MKKYIRYYVWYKTRSGKHTRQIEFNSYQKALGLYNNLNRDFKYLIGINENNVAETICKGGNAK